MRSQSDQPTHFVTDSRRFRAMIEHSWDVIKLLSADGSILYISPAARRVLDVEPGDVLGSHARDLLHPDDFDRVVTQFNRLVAADPPDQPLRLTYRCRRGDGDYVWMEGVFTNMLDEPDVGAVVLNERDITERKRAVEDRDDLLHREQAARADAEAAIRARDSFLSIVSHELRTPLTPVLLCVSDLQRDPAVSRHASEELTMIREQIELEAQLIDDLLDLTRIGQNRIILHPQVLDAHAVIREALQTAARDIRDKRLVVRLELNAASSRVYADPRRLRQIFWNVLSNAAKFTPAGGSITVRTWNSAESPGPRKEQDAPAQSSVLSPRHLIVEIHDTGIGFSPETSEKLFHPFEQAEQSLTRRFGGLGLGLTIAKSLVDLHNGSIHAASPGLNQGATFTLQFPALSSGGSPSSSPLATGNSPLAMTSRNILLVEDNRQTLAAMARLLQSAGHVVHTADTSDSALRSLEQHPVDLLVCDIGLPDGSGWELLRRVHAVRTVPAIALSGFGSDEDLERSRRAGFAVHLVKPVAPQKLYDAIALATAQAPAK